MQTLSVANLIQNSGREITLQKEANKKLETQDDWTSEFPVHKSPSLLNWYILKIVMQEMKQHLSQKCKVNKGCAPSKYILSYLVYK